MAADGDPATFWVSNGSKPGEGPKSDRHEWLELRFAKPFPATRLTIIGREGYGPRQVT